MVYIEWKYNHQNLDLWWSNFFNETYIVFIVSLTILMIQFIFLVFKWFIIKEGLRNQYKKLGEIFYFFAHLNLFSLKLAYYDLYII